MTDGQGQDVSSPEVVLPSVTVDTFDPTAEQSAPLTSAEIAEAAGVRNYLLYSLSLPERALRGATGIVGGAVRHGAALLVPQAFQDSKTYAVLVRSTLDWLIDDIAGVKAVKPPTANDSPTNGLTANDPNGACAANPTPAAVPAVADDFVARKTVGSFVDLAGMATLHLSPALLLAVVSDVAYGSQTFIKELGGELKQKGVIAENSTLENAGDLLAAVGKASSVTADAFNAPPISADGLKETIDQTRDAVRAIDPAQVLPRAEVERLWNEMREIADREGISVLELSSAMTLHSLGKIGTLGQGALSSARAAGTLFDRHVVDHYREALADIRQRGFYASLAETSGPYVDALWRNFSSEKTTLTEDLVTGRLWSRAAGAVRGWLGRKDAPNPAAPGSIVSESSAANSSAVDRPAE